MGGLLEIRVDRKSREVLLRIPKLTDQYRKNVESALYDIGDEVVKETRKLIRRRNKTGRLYNFRGRLHRASAPGEAPANMTGRLLKSSDYTVPNYQQMTVGEEAPYAVFLELGTRKMAPRPHLITAIHNKAGVTYKLLEEAGRIS